MEFKLDDVTHTTLYLIQIFDVVIIMYLPQQTLTDAQKRIYSLEKAFNFRWISRLIADCSPRPLTQADSVSPDLEVEISELGECISDGKIPTYWLSGQFAELAYSTVPLAFVFEHLPSLTQVDFPLEEYDALVGSELVSDFFGTKANLHGFVAWRQQTKQLIVAISGTATFEQSLHDLRGFKHTLSSGKGAAHSGFWDLYKGMKSQALESVQNALEEHDVSEIVVTGHSLGGAISYFLMMHLMEDSLIAGKRLKLAVFGSPRPGDQKLASSWQEMVQRYRTQHGEHSFEEHSIKAYNDGVTALPPLFLGYRHFTRNPLYFVNSRLFRVPETECEYSLFQVPENDATGPHPLGGHNYYGGRDLEKALRRRMGWLGEVLAGKESWEERYKEYITRHEKSK